MGLVGGIQALQVWLRGSPSSKSSPPGLSEAMVGPHGSSVSHPVPILSLSPVAGFLHTCPDSFPGTRDFQPGRLGHLCANFIQGRFSGISPPMAGAQGRLSLEPKGTLLPPRISQNVRVERRTWSPNAVNLGQVGNGGACQADSRRQAPEVAVLCCPSTWPIIE